MKIDLNIKPCPKCGAEGGIESDGQVMRVKCTKCDNATEYLMIIESPKAIFHFGLPPSLGTVDDFKKMCSDVFEYDKIAEFKEMFRGAVIETENHLDGEKLNTYLMLRTGHDLGLHELMAASVIMGDILQEDVVIGGCTIDPAADSDGEIYVQINPANTE